MRCGFGLPQSGKVASGDAIAKVAKRAEELGYVPWGEPNAIPRFAQADRRRYGGNSRSRSYRNLYRPYVLPGRRLAVELYFDDGTDAKDPLITSASSSHASNSCPTVLPVIGSIKSRAISAKGTSTNRRAGNLGCGMTSPGLRMTLSP
jgi:hypothetical protein